MVTSYEKSVVAAAMQTGYMPDIDGLRGIAIIFVLLFHWLPDHFPGGFIGVDIFFGISGYLITRSLQRLCTYNPDANNPSRIWILLTFYESRARRILPACLATLAAILPVIYKYGQSREVKAYRRNYLCSLFMVENFCLEQNGRFYFQLTRDANFFMHFWSLSVEEQFYIVYPALFILLARIKRSLQVGSLFIAMLISLFTQFMTANSLSMQSVVKAFYLPWFRAWQLLAGCLVGVLIDQTPKTTPAENRKVAIITSVMICGGILSMITLCYGSFPYLRGIDGIAPTMATVAYLSLPKTSTAPKLLTSLTLLRWIGLISYSLYLLHWPFTVMAYRLHLHPLILALPVFCLAALSFKLVETPFRSRKVMSTGKVLIFLAIGIVALTLSGRNIQTQARGIWPQSHSSPMRQTVDIDRNATSSIDLLFIGDSMLTLFVNPVRVECRRRNLTVRFINIFGQLIIPGIKRYGYRFGSYRVKKVKSAETGKALVTETMGKRMPKFVILVFAWDAYLGFGSATDYRGVLALEKPRVFKAPKAIDVIEQALLNFSQASYHKYGTRTAVVQPTPLFDFDPCEDLQGTSTTRNGSDSLLLHFIPKGRLESNAAKFDARITTSAAHRPSYLRYIRIRETLCPTANTCLVGRNGRCLFHDRRHLNEEGVRFLMARIFDSLPFDAHM